MEFLIAALTVWDLCVLVEGIMNVDNGAKLEYIIGFLALNLRVILLRIALWKANPTYLRYVQIAGSVMFFVFYMIPGDYPQNNTVFNSFEAQVVYYAVTLVIGLVNVQRRTPKPKPTPVERNEKLRF